MRASAFPDRSRSIRVAQALDVLEPADDRVEAFARVEVDGDVIHSAQDVLSDWRIAAAARRPSAASVRVGLAVPTVGKTAVLITKQLRWPCTLSSASTTEVRGSAPMRHVPMMWPAPNGLVGVVDIRSAEPLEQALVRLAAGGEAAARVVARSVTERWARDPERVALFCQRHAVARVGQWLGEAREA